MGQGVTEEDIEYISHINPKILNYVCLGYTVIFSYLFYLYLDFDIIF